MIKKFIKTHEHAWVLVYFVFYMPWYFGLQQRDISHFFDMYVGLDRIIPFVPAFIIPYVYWFLFVGKIVNMMSEIVIPQARNEKPR